MFDRLLDLIIQLWEEIIPFIIILEYQEAVVLRFGKFCKVIKKGVHFKIPFFDNITKQHTTITTIGLPPQSLTTKDGQSIVVRGMIKYKIADVHNYIVLVYDAKDAMVDTTCGIIREIVNDKTWQEIQLGKIDNMISKKVTLAMKDYGIEVHWVTLTDMALMKSLRLFTNGSHINEVTN